MNTWKNIEVNVTGYYYYYYYIIIIKNKKIKNQPAKLKTTTRMKTSFVEFNSIQLMLIHLSIIAPFWSFSYNSSIRSIRANIDAIDARIVYFLHPLKQY